jgi:hypothetical protein
MWRAMAAVQRLLSHDMHSKLTPARMVHAAILDEFL